MKNLDSNTQKHSSVFVFAVSARLNGVAYYVIPEREVHVERERETKEREGIAYIVATSLRHPTSTSTSTSTSTATTDN
eukprot:scaffold1275_cov247-Chaetoceros_neogracile.AAC.4